MCCWDSYQLAQKSARILDGSSMVRYSTEDERGGARCPKMFLNDDMQPAVNLACFFIWHIRLSAISATLGSMEDERGEAGCPQDVSK